MQRQQTTTSIRFRHGFSLIELTIVIVLLSVLALGVSSYIGLGATMYSDATEREQILNQSRFVAERLQRELRNAAPNSIRTADVALLRCIEFAPIVSSGIYLQAPVAPEAGTELKLAILNWQSSYLGAVPTLPLSIYPRQPGDIYSNNGSTIAFAGTETDDMDGNSATRTVQLASSHSFPLGSPEQRFYLLASSPVSYCFNAVDGTIRRYSNYPYNTLQPLPPTGSAVLMASDVQRVRFAVNDAVLTRNSVVNLLLQFGQSQTSDMFFNYEVHIPNVP
ncbi:MULTISPECIES: PilW family protein [unclassified Arsukibacterium]|uniref:PilW family protein n=1 Tax=unclassified Arsukibacterium TaxID=2635278 RepID=UPI000C3EB653|nr:MULTISPECIES: type II secretion system protein [unclassified Arsukibacterium]MAA94995.1 prepilin-type cleavage/methylation domain-containing protein [Rheinheimera sp.]MBM35391.1 prepilin-type cleavage/methylation domain-containing protein [Rheinheimera sp.]HAW94517.1 prepilin-type cleavage/methylation domain-containing protein [Candidatus Azambacteria bacterium]|tara:strand:+ start:1702 stop:2535 length:834 start_codon:yes stop_codon:yes gene_type:complete